MDDPRNIKTGRLIPTAAYCDQPYVVRTDDGAWLCVVTTGAGREGQAGQHIVTLRSADHGQTWSAPVDVEPADGPEASYAVLLKAPPGSPNAGRVYCFYNHNADNVREVIAEPGAWMPDGVCRRVDSLGHFVFRWSDNGGRTWSARRYDIPLRDFEIDRQNAYGGALKFFWNVGKPFVLDGAAYVPLHKVGGFGEGFFTRSEGALLRSSNLLSERDPARAHWETLPDGEVGLRAPRGGPIAEEQSCVTLSDGTIYCVYRTVDGYPACAYSRDGGRTWTPPQDVCYADGRRIKHPRAANFVWKCANGRYLYWFHCHGGRFIGEHPQCRTIAYQDRNPAWLCGGVEVDTPAGKALRWSQPEIVLYDEDPLVRISYPDLIEENGQYWITETQKSQARIHEIDAALLEGLWGQFAEQSVAPAAEGLILSLPAANGALPPGAPLPASWTAAAAHLAGFTVEVRLRLDHLDAGQIVLDNRTAAGQGFCLRTAAGGAIEIVLNDGRTENCWASDPGLIEAGCLHHAAVIVDGGPRVIVWVFDGRLNDGGEARQFGWGRFSPHLRGVNGDSMLRIAPAVCALRLYGRARRVSELGGV
ncbi:MAG: exo-alpha-sialidase [Anaerolineae bacterium]|nr:exo-alpha-sialidase [Anaerolineae bacterium]